MWGGVGFYQHEPEDFQESVSIVRSFINVGFGRYSCCFSLMLFEAQRYHRKGKKTQLIIQFNVWNGGRLFQPIADNVTMETSRPSLNQLEENEGNQSVTLCVQALSSESLYWLKVNYNVIMTCIITSNLVKCSVGEKLDYIQFEGDVFTIT